MSACHIVAVANQKGGVGKTVMAFNLAHGLARKGKRVLAIDNDPQGNLTLGFIGNKGEIRSTTDQLYRGDVKEIQGVGTGSHLWLYGVSSDGQALEAAAEASDGPSNFQSVLEKLGKSGHFDYIIIDTNPYFSNLTIAAFVAATVVFIPLEASENALKGASRLLKELSKLKREGYSNARWLGFAVNKLRPTSYQRMCVHSLRKAFPEDVFETTLSQLTAFEESPGKQKSVWEYDPEGQAAFQMEVLVQEFLKRIKALTGK